MGDEPEETLQSSAPPFSAQQVAWLKNAFGPGPSSGAPNPDKEATGSQRTPQPGKSIAGISYSNTTRHRAFDL